MEALKRGGKIKTRKPRKPTKTVKRKVTTTRQTAVGKKIAQFKGTGAQVVLNIKNPITRGREVYNQAAASQVSSVLPTLLASQQQSEGRMEALFRQRMNVEEHERHANAVRAAAVGRGDSLAAEDAARVQRNRANERRNIEAAQRKAQEDLLQVVGPPATETRELGQEELRIKRLRALSPEPRFVKPPTTGEPARRLTPRGGAGEDTPKKRIILKKPLPRPSAPVLSLPAPGAAAPPANVPFGTAAATQTQARMNLIRNKSIQELAQMEQEAAARVRRGRGGAGERRARIQLERVKRSIEELSRRR